MCNSNNKLKIPSALQWAWQRCATVMLCMVLVFFGCKEDKEAQKMDEESFAKSLESAPVALVNLEQLPEWLQEKINEFEKLFSESLVESFRSSSKNWVLIWKKEGLLPKSALSYGSDKDKYEFPDISNL